jgi:hypothetical protein
MQKNVDGANHYAQQLQMFRANNLQKQPSAAEWQLMTGEEIYILFELFMLMKIVQKTSLRLQFL